MDSGNLQKMAEDKYPYQEWSENKGVHCSDNDIVDYMRSAFIAGMQARGDEIERLNNIIDIKEKERKEWADMCIKKQQLIDICRMAVEEIVNKETDPMIAALGALVTFNHVEPDEKTRAWAMDVIEKHKAEK